MTVHAHFLYKTCGQVYCDSTPSVRECEQCGSCAWLLLPAGTQLHLTVNGRTASYSCLGGIIIPRGRTTVQFKRKPGRKLLTTG